MCTAVGRVVVVVLDLACDYVHVVSADRSKLVVRGEDREKQERGRRRTGKQVVGGASRWIR